MRECFIEWHAQCRVNNILILNSLRIIISVKEMNMNNEYLIVFCTVPDEDTASEISLALVNEKLAACCNIVKGLRSIYFWENEVCDESEMLLIIKTKTTSYENLQSRILNLHPYDVPEVLAITIAKGSQEYLKWVDENVK